jgi:branched-chain amino acid transport system ATP-binding protein
MSAGGDRLLEARDVVAGYDGNIVLNGASLDVREGEMVGVVGHNGAGKSTLLKAVYGLLRVGRGAILVDGVDVTHETPEAHTRRGIGYVPQERNVFPNLSVRENLELGAVLLAGDPGYRAKVRERIDEIFALFPVLAERQRQLAGSMSGGEQRMVAIGIGLMLRPRIVLLDEPTTGLAPIFVDKLMRAIEGLNRSQGLAVVLVEQNIVSLLRVVQRVFAVKVGRSAVIDRPVAALDEHAIWAIL